MQRCRCESQRGSGAAQSESLAQGKQCSSTQCSPRGHGPAVPHPGPEAPEAPEAPELAGAPALGASPASSVLPAAPACPGTSNSKRSLQAVVRDGSPRRTPRAHVTDLLDNVSLRLTGSSRLVAPLARRTHSDSERDNARPRCGRPGLVRSPRSAFVPRAHFQRAGYLGSA